MLGDIRRASAPEEGAIESTHDVDEEIVGLEGEEAAAAQSRDAVGRLEEVVGMTVSGQRRFGREGSPAVVFALR